MTLIDRESNPVSKRSRSICRFAIWITGFAIVLIAALVVPAALAPAVSADALAGARITGGQPFTLDFPRLGMWWPDINNQSLEKIARYDWLILGDWDKSFVPAIRALNPNIVLLNSANACELDYDPSPNASPAVNAMARAVPPEWFLTQVGSTLVAPVDAAATTFRVAAVTATKGSKIYNLFVAGDTALIGGESVYIQSVNKTTRILTVRRGYIRPASAHAAGERVAAHVTYWPHTWMLNLSTLAPKGVADPAVGLESWAEYNARVSAALASDADWDGILLDRSDPDESWVIGNSTARTIDPDQSNTLLTDYSAFDATWNAGLRELETRLRGLVGTDKVIFSNWGMANYDLLNGNNFESFPDKRGGYFSSPWKKIVFGPTTDGSYFDWMSHALQPNLTMIETYQNDASPSATGKGVSCASMGIVPNYRKMRFGLATTLLNDGFFNYKMMTNDHGAWCPTWFDEYDNAGKGRGYLGQPLGSIQKALPVLSTPNLVLGGGMDSQADLDRWGLWADQGNAAAATIDSSSPATGTGAVKLSITQAQGTDWKISLTYEHVPMVSKKEYTLRFWAKADQPRQITVWVQQQKSPWKTYLNFGHVSLTTEWQQFEIGGSALGSNKAAGLMFALGETTGSVWLDGIQLQAGSREVYRRDFTNGIVLINPTGTPKKIDLGGTFLRINGRQQPAINNGKPVSSVILPPLDGLILLRP